MPNVISILGVTLLCLAVMAFQPTQSSGNMEIAVDTADSGPEKPRPDRKAEYSQAESIVVGNIQYEIEKTGTEKVCFVLNRFCNPKVFSIEGNNPRIVIDIENVYSWKGKSRIPVNALLIKRVRTHFHRGHNKLRIVLDLSPSIDYVVEPLYYKAERVYCIEVKKSERDRKPRTFIRDKTDAISFKAKTFCGCFS